MKKRHYSVRHLAMMACCRGGVVEGCSGEVVVEW